MAGGTAELAVASMDEAALMARLRELSGQQPDLGYRAAHTALQAEAAFKGVGLKKVQKMLREVREQSQKGSVASGAAGAAMPSALPSTAPAIKGKPATKTTWSTDEVTISRPDLEHKFGMLIGTEIVAEGGQTVTQIRPGGMVDAWNEEHAELAIREGDVLTAVNGKGSLEEMQAEFRTCLSCTLSVRRAPAKQQEEELNEKEDLEGDASEGAKEVAEWEKRKMRVTAALIPGLKKIMDSQFGAGASGRIGRVETMYERVGRSEAFEEDSELGKRYAPGYIEGLTPVQPFHRTQDHSWCAELRSHWKAIRKELLGQDDAMWTPGAYQASNEAYGKDWKIMGVFTADAWQDEKRFAVTSRVVKQLKGVKVSEAFFARMPPQTKIASHSDNLNYILTSHLALDLEEGKCAIKVGNTEKKWKEGEMLVFDTSYMHSTRNDSNRNRYVLVLRFWHPGLTEEERHAIHLSHAILAGASGGTR